MKGDCDRKEREMEMERESKEGGGGAERKERGKMGWYENGREKECHSRGEI